MTSKRLVVIDPGFQGTGGHHLSTNGMIASRASEAGLECVVVANARCGTEALAPFYADVLPALSHGIYHQRQTLDVDELRGLNQRAAADLVTIPESMFDADTHVLVHTVSSANILAIAEFLASCVREHGCSATLGLMFPPGVSAAGEVLDMPEESIYRKALAVVEETDDLTAFGIGASIAEAASCLVSSPIESLAPPVSRPTEAQLDKARSKILLYVGDSRNDKGFYLIPETLRMLLERGVKRPIVVQLSTIHPVMHGSLADRIRELAVRYPNVELCEGRASNDLYKAWWSSAALACMFYDQRQYGHQTSNLCWEAMSYGVPAVVSPGLWHATELRRYGFHFVEATGQWPSDCADAVVSALANLAALAHSARAHRLEFLEQSSELGVFEPVDRWLRQR